MNLWAKYLSIMLLLANSMVCSQQTKIPDYSNCGQNPQSQKLARLIIETNQQLRSELICNKKLAQLASEKAKLMANSNKIQHRIKNTTPNQFLRQQGIKLPKNYPLFDNQVESIMGSVKTAQESFDVFMSSPDHKMHLMGEKEFLLLQNQLGVGFYQDDSSEFVYHWVVYITEIVSE